MYLENQTGFIEWKQDTDLLFGVSSPIKETVRVVNSDWREFKPEHELQVSTYFDTYWCTNFGGWNSIETIMTYDMHNGLMPVVVSKFLVDNDLLKNGFVNFSERRTCNFSEITIGSWTQLYKAANAIRKHPLAEVTMPYLKNMSAEQFYNTDDFTPELDKIEKKFLDLVQINWSWTDNPEEAIKTSPLTATVRYATGDGFLAPAGNHNHCVCVLAKIEWGWVIFDSYQQAIKFYKDGYVANFINWSVTYKENNMNVSDFIKTNDQKLIRNTDNGSYGVILQGKLRVITPERAGLFMVDREARGIIGKLQMVSISGSDWNQLPSELF